MPDRLTAVIADVLRDQLAWDWNGEPGDPDSSCGQAGHMPSGSEVIDELAAEVAAAIRDDQTVRTVEELEALPVGTIIEAGDYLLRNRGWITLWQRELHVSGDTTHPYDVRTRDIPLPARVVWRPGQEVDGE